MIERDLREAIPVCPAAVARKAKPSSWTCISACCREAERTHQCGRIVTSAAITAACFVSLLLVHFGLSRNAEANPHHPTSFQATGGEALFAGTLNQSQDESFSNFPQQACAFTDRRRRVARLRNKKGGRSKADIERERNELAMRTQREVEEIAAEFHAKLSRNDARAIGAAYGRYSSRSQDSIADQIRTLFECAAREQIFIPLENIFYDLAVRGYRDRRPGLNALREAAAQKRFTVFFAFSTSRLFRKVYKALQFVEEQMVEVGIRCVFAKSNIDTANGEQWRTLLQIHAALDEAQVPMYADNIRAAHEGMFLRNIICTSLTLGYCGETVPGEFSKRQRPRQRIIIDEVGARYIKLIYHWFVVERLSMAEIARRLNDDQDAPAPLKSLTGVWTPLLVRAHLQNERYRGWWEYGKYKTVWLSGKDHAIRVRREQPLRAQQIEELRIISDETWFMAQGLLNDSGRNSGRKPKDGDRKARPRLLRELYICQEHKCRLTAGGPFGHTLFCQRCSLQAPGNRSLYSSLNRRLALQLLCKTVAAFLEADQELPEQVVTACLQEISRLQQPDSRGIRQLRARIEKLTSAINVNMRDPGDNDADRDETLRRVKELRRERTECQHQLATLEDQQNRVVVAPSAEDVRRLLAEMAQILVAATQSENDAELAEAREIIMLLTGGKIELCQAGERARKRGWLQGRFRLRLLSIAVSQFTGVQVDEEGILVTIDYRRSALDDDDMETVWRLYKQGRSNAQIRAVLNCSKARVLLLLKRASERHGQTLDDPRERSRQMLQDADRRAEYKEIADKVQHMWWEELLSLREIGRRCNCTDTTAKKALTFWYTSRALPVPTDAMQRDRIAERMWLMASQQDLQVQQIAEAMNYSRATVTKLLKAYCASNNLPWVDGRSRPGAKAKAVRRPRNECPPDETTP